MSEMLTLTVMQPTGNLNQTIEKQNCQKLENELNKNRELQLSCIDASLVTIMETNVNNNNKKRLSDELSFTNENELRDYAKSFEFAMISNSSNGSLYLNEFDQSNEKKTALSDLLMTSANVQLINQENRIRIALNIIFRLVLPLANGIIRSLRGIRGIRILRILKNFAHSRQALSNMLAYATNTISMSLSSVHVTYRIEPLLKMVKICKGPVSEIPESPNSESVPFSLLFREPKSLSSCSVLKFTQPVESKAPKCVTVNVIAEPPPGTEIGADIVIIHGLHGSLKNTWKQGLWNNDRHPVNFKRPPKPPVRAAKRPRHSRSNIFDPPHREKRARFIDQEHFDAMSSNEALYSYESDSKEIIFLDGFPTFRLRMEDHGLLMQDVLDVTTPDGAKDEQKTSVNNSSYSNCWPADWLPIDCPGVRVISVSYTTDPYLWRPFWKKKEPRTNLVERSREMSELLIKHRVGDGHPIVWVGHSKGGLFIKQIIVDAWESGRSAAAPLWRSSRGTFFYSVPHRGSHLASIKAPLLCRSVELLDVEKNSKYLLDLHRRFVGLYQMGLLKIEIFSFVETALTLMSVLFLRIVGVDSGDPGIGDVCGIQLDHREICKPRSRDCILYKELVKMIKKVC